MIQLPEEIVELIISFYDPLWEKKRIRKEINILCFKILQLRKKERYADLKNYLDRSIWHYGMGPIYFDKQRPSPIQQDNQTFEVKSNNDGTWRVLHGNKIINIKSN